jgi:hypothetical protein
VFLRERGLRGGSDGGDPECGRQGTKAAVVLEADDVERRAVDVRGEPTQELAEERRPEGGLVAADEERERVGGGRETRREPGEGAPAGEGIAGNEDGHRDIVRERRRGRLGPHDDHDLVDDHGDLDDGPVEKRPPVHLRGQLVATEAG